MVRKHSTFVWVVAHRYLLLVAIFFAWNSLSLLIFKLPRAAHWTSKYPKKLNENKRGESMLANVIIVWKVLAKMVQRNSFSRSLAVNDYLLKIALLVWKSVLTWEISTVADLSSDCERMASPSQAAKVTLTFRYTATVSYNVVSFFTSMFVGRMEVLEYRQQFEVVLSTFPDSTNTETPRKLVFSLTCVCLSVYAKKFVSGYLTKGLADLDENYGVSFNWRRIENLP